MRNAARKAIKHNFPEPTASQFLWNIPEELSRGCTCVVIFTARYFLRTVPQRPLRNNLRLKTFKKLSFRAHCVTIVANKSSKIVYYWPVLRGWLTSRLPLSLVNKVGFPTSFQSLHLKSQQSCKLVRYPQIFSKIILRGS